jgi:hypothetical protein
MCCGCLWRCEMSRQSAHIRRYCQPQALAAFHSTEIILFLSLVLISVRCRVNPRAPNRTHVWIHCKPMILYFICSWKTRCVVSPCTRESGNINSQRDMWQPITFPLQVTEYRPSRNIPELEFVRTDDSCILNSFLSCTSTSCI